MQRDIRAQQRMLRGSRAPSPTSARSSEPAYGTHTTRPLPHASSPPPLHSSSFSPSSSGFVSARSPCRRVSRTNEARGAHRRTHRRARRLDGRMVQPPDRGGIRVLSSFSGPAIHPVERKIAMRLNQTRTSNAGRADSTALSPELLCRCLSMLTLFLFTSLTLTGSSQASPILSEIYYDAVGSDDGHSFVEIQGEPGPCSTG